MESRIIVREKGKVDKGDLIKITFTDVGNETVQFWGEKVETEDEAFGRAVNVDDRGVWAIVDSIKMTQLVLEAEQSSTVKHA